MTQDISKELEEIARSLNQRGIEYALCGGLAVAVHGFPRATKDIDIMISESDLKRVLSILDEKGFNLEAGIIPFNTGKETEFRIFRISKASGEDLMTVDLVLVSPVLNEVWEGRETFRMENYELKVVSLPGLKKMKLLAGRPQDLADLKQLEELE